MITSPEIEFHTISEMHSYVLMSRKTEIVYLRDYCFYYKGYKNVDIVLFQRLRLIYHFWLLKVTNLIRKVIFLFIFDKMVRPVFFS